MEHVTIINTHASKVVGSISFSAWRTAKEFEDDASEKSGHVYLSLI